MDRAEKSGADGQLVPGLVPGPELLAETAKTRREALGITQEDVAERYRGPSVASLRTIENGQSESYRAKTLLSLDQALAWPPGAAQALLSGDYARLLNFADSMSPDVRSYYFDSEIWEHITSGNDILTTQLTHFLISFVPADAADRYDVLAHPSAARGFRTEFEGGSAIDFTDPQSKYHRVMMALVDLTADELEELGKFALDLAKLSRLLHGNAIQRLLGESKEITGNTRAAIAEVVAQISEASNTEG